MANKKITELTELTTPADADLLVIVDDSEASGEQTKKITHANYQAAVLSHDTELGFNIGGTEQIELVDGELLPTYDNDINLGSSSQAYKRGFFYAGITIGGVSQGIDVTAALHRKILEIGAWNMDVTAAVNVAHGLTLSKIRNISVVITDDEGNAHYPINYSNGSAPNGWAYATGSNIVLVRLSSGFFDSSSFNFPTGNRGWVVIDYVS